MEYLGLGFYFSSKFQLSVSADPVFPSTPFGAGEREEAVVEECVVGSISLVPITHVGDLD